MALLAAGSSVAVALAAGSTLTLSGGIGTAQVAPGAPAWISKHLMQVSTSKTVIGPFVSDCTVNVSATTAMNYVTTPATAAAVVSSANSAVVVGDSIVANGIPAAGTWGTRSIVRHANRSLGLPFDILSEQGFPGFTTAQVAAQWASAVAPYEPATVFWHSGVNNINLGQTADQAFAEIRAVWQRCVSEGRRFVYMMTGMTYGAQLGRERAKYLAQCRQFARRNASFEFVDIASPVLDFNQAAAALGDGTVLTNYVLDGTHPTARACVAQGAALGQHLTRRGYPDTPALSPFVNNGSSGGDDLTNLVVNGLVGSSGSSWAGFLTPANTRTPGSTAQNAMGTTGLQANLPGRLYHVVWTPNVSPADSDQFGLQVAVDFNGSAAALAGRTFVFRAYIKASSSGGVMHQVSARAWCTSWDSITTYFDVTDNYCFDTGAGIATHTLNASSYEGVFETPPFTFPAGGVTQLHTAFQGLIKAAAGATVTADFGCFEAREVFNL